MAAPAEFVIIRHLLEHPEDTPAQIAKHCALHDETVRKAIKRLAAENLIGHESMLSERLRDHPRRIKHRQYTFRAPNPDQFLQAFEAPHWLSGEYAAASEGYDIVPEKAILYIHNDDLKAATAAARASFAKVASESESNVIVRIADSWLYLDPASDFVERGQRLLDYFNSRHIQLLRELSLG